MKRKIKIILYIIIFIIVILILLFIPNKINNNYQNNIISKLEETNKTKITYYNYYNKYLIVKTKDNIIVYNTKYDEITKENIDKITILDYDIIYKKGKLMYEQTILSKNKVKYLYYDIKTGKKIDSLEIEDNYD